MRSIKTAVFLGALFLALGAFASQNPSAPATPGQPPNQAPSSPSAGATDNTQQAPPQSQSNAPRPGAQQGSASLDDQVNTLNQLLNLSPEQQIKAKTILQDQHDQAMAIVGDNSATRDQKMQKIMTLREGTISKMRGILTSEQKPKFDEMVKQQNERLRQQQQQQPPQPNPGSPK